LKNLKTDVDPHGTQRDHLFSNTPSHDGINVKSLDEWRRQERNVGQLKVTSKEGE